MMAPVLQTEVPEAQPGAPRTARIQQLYKGLVANHDLDELRLAAHRVQKDRGMFFSGSYLTLYNQINIHSPKF